MPAMPLTPDELLTTTRSVRKRLDLTQMYYYGPHMSGDSRVRDQFRGHPWFDATVEFCEHYDENCFDPDYDWLPLAHFAPAVEEVFTREPSFR